MAYHIRYRPQAKSEASDLRRTYSTQFSNDFDNWLAHIADAAERRDHSGSVEIIGSLEVLSKNLERLKELTLWKQVRALVVSAKKRCPPWEFRMSSAWFRLLESVSAEVQAYYEIDHAEARVIFTKFELGDSGSSDCDVIE